MLSIALICKGFENRKDEHEIYNESGTYALRVRTVSNPRYFCVKSDGSDDHSMVQEKFAQVARSSTINIEGGLKAWIQKYCSKHGLIWFGFIAYQPL